MRLSLIILFVFYSKILSFGQQSLEISLIAGTSYYRGDLNENNVVSKLLRPDFGGAILYNLRPTIIIKGQLMAGKIAGDDQYTPNKFIRGAYFENWYYTFGAAIEYLPLREPRYEKGGFRQSWSPYISLGIEYLRSVDNVQCRYCDNSKLPETGDKDSFITIPFGFGARYDFDSHFSVGTEVIWHAALSDYLDGVSKLGNATNKDWIIGANFFVSYFFGIIQPDLNIHME
ncbi:MAG TPA: DUF6089 family protein [Saprospiraceae bacterium]|nr:DUF6089 family protein [Saprospiraceae bacterium]